MDILPVWSGWNEQCEAVMQRYISLRHRILESGLAGDIERNPLLNVSVYLQPI